MAESSSAPWWHDAVVYQVYVRSYADSDGDGMGDLPGATARLDHIAGLGVDAIWLNPFYVSPQHDAGYDVADYCDVDPRFGTLADADALIARAHELGLRVIVDIVPNHSSAEHPWFQEALTAEPDSAARERYLFRTGKAGGAEPPNNWGSMFGGPAWTRVGDTDQWYLHLFDSSQPDFNWRNPEVHAMFEEVLRFWLERGADGFRIDVAHALYKVESLPDQVLPPAGEPYTPEQDPMWDQPEVHDVYRRWHEILAEYDAMAVAEAWVASQESAARYVRADELDQTFNFAWLETPWSASAFATVISETLAAIDDDHASPTWVLSNHDVKRHVTRYDGGPVGLARARAATLTMLALPGSSYLYQGEELGLEEADVPPDARQDPWWFRTGEPGRDGCRVPIPWSGDAPPYGFGPGVGQPWLPQPPEWAALSVAAQDGVPGSTLEFYREALRARRAYAAPAGRAIADVAAAGDVLTFRRGAVQVVLNCGADAVPLPAGEVIVASGPLDGDRLPANTAVWLR